MSHLVKFEMNLLEEKKMHALFSRRFVVGSSSSWQLTKSHWSQSRHILSHPLPSGLASSFSSSSVTRFVPSLLSLSEKAQGSGSLLEARAGFFDPQLLPKPWVFTGFQKRGWKSWFNGANGAVFGLIIANVAVLTMWKTSDPQWMSKNFVLSSYTFMSGRIHTLITSGFSNVGTSQLIVNMIGLYYFGTSKPGIVMLLDRKNLGTGLPFEAVLCWNTCWLSSLRKCAWCNGNTQEPRCFLQGSIKTHWNAELHGFIQGSIKTHPFTGCRGTFICHYTT
ncbi:rhomboid-like protein 16, chloroplastic isoform X7 [Brassica rapa]|uniref:rhomboid-like protein 16, chloroplastic isoform X7 n=1 Tax=Brassica campestris TaxID=3711 RepID=UPI00142DD7F7|nr:rhomboid-like protein 16, chloroplastic isoform X7 [Brassica rapa]